MRKHNSLFRMEMVDPNEDKCPECQCGLGVHLATCSHFRKCAECGFIGSDKKLGHRKDCSHRQEPNEN